MATFADSSSTAFHVVSRNSCTNSNDDAQYCVISLEVLRTALALGPPSVLQPICMNKIGLNKKLLHVLIGNWAGDINHETPCRGKFFGCECFVEPLAKLAHKSVHVKALFSP